MAWLKNLRLNSINPDVRSKAVETLDGSGNSPDTDRIFASLADESPQVRCAAIRALERAHNQDSVRSLIGALRDVDYEVRESAARALGLLRDVTSVEPLVECLRDPEPTVRTEAARALQALAWMPVTEEELAWFDIALGKTALRDTSSENADPYLAEPRSYPSLEGPDGTESLQGADDHQNLRVFLAGLGDSNPAIRISAIRSLAHVPGEEVTAKILRLFRDRDPHVRLAAIQALAGRDDPAPAFFLGLLDEPNPEIRLAAIEFLARVRHPQIVEQLLPLLLDEDGTIRQATASALGAIGNVSAIEALVVSLIDEAPEVRHAAESALEQIDPNWVFSQPTQMARAQIEATFSICSQQAQTVILQVLAKLPAAATTDVHNGAHPQS
jgi:HEAT repeat protein